MKYSGGSGETEDWDLGSSHSSSSRFDNLISYAQKQSIYAVDCASINRIVPDNTPRVAAAALAEMRSRKRSSLSFTTGSRLGSLSDVRKGSIASTNRVSDS